MARGYGNDLAYVHDTGFGGFAEGAAPGLLKILRHGGVRDGLVVDLGCGSGIWARVLSRAGYDVLGVDLSRAMVRIARRKAPRAKFRVASLLDTPIPECRAVTSLGECFNYLFDRRSDVSRLKRVFGRVFAALTPGGLFIFDMAEPGRGDGGRQAHRIGNDFAIVHEVEEDVSRRLLTRKITTFRRVGRLYRRGEETHHLRLYDGREIARLLRSAGFRVRQVRGYGTMRFPDSYAGFIARKP